MELVKNPKVEEIFNSCPTVIQQKLKYLRQLIIDTASETEGLETLEETLKWGEPSFVTKHGSTVRINWKKPSPDQYAMYFTCTSGLVDTFRMVYGDRFVYEGNRAIVFDVTDEIPVQELKHCVSLALTYHKVKHLPMLGV